MKINFNKIHNMFLRKSIKKVFNICYLELKMELPISVNVTFVNEDEIKKLNKEFRNKDKVTDVLSFPLEDFAEQVQVDNEEFVDIGDIVICKSVAKRQAKNLNNSFKREVCFLALHGFLHLLGYDHEEESEDAPMFEIQKKVLNLANIRRKNV